LLDRLKTYLPPSWRKNAPVVPVVRLAGVIGAGGAFRPGLSLSSIGSSLERAFAVRGAPAVALIINSPGGSPVQSHLIFKRIRQLSEEKKRPVIAYLEDVAASGGYMIACAADEIVADPSSIVGSIGVISASFGLDNLISRFGIERRVYTAGTRKATLDPFLPENPEDVVHLKALQTEVHRHFIDLVRSRRGDALATEEDLFTGLFWSGETARSLGLVDRLGDVRSDLRARFGDKTMPRLIANERSLMRRRLLGIGAPGPLISADDMIAALDHRALYSRYGL
jgi:signal peptide peptidase SppA